MEERIFLARQPILDRQQNLFAYELLFRDSASGTANVKSDLAATAQVITRLFSEMGVQAVLGQALGFINVSREMLLSDMIELLPANQIVLEILETVAVDRAVVDRCVALKKAGFTLALDDFTVLREEYRMLLPLVDIVKVDVMGMDTAALHEACQRLKPWPAKLLAEKIDDRGQFATCLELGFHYFQGYFFARPSVMEARRADPSQLTLLKLLALVLEDAETTELENAFKQDPKLTYSLLRLTNSVACGVTQRIRSLSQAIVVLGRRQLLRWLQLLLFALEQGSGPYPTPLMRLAAARGKTMEILARIGAAKDRVLQDQAFMTGVFSLLDVLLGQPLADLVEQLRLDDDLKSALLERRGQLGRLLRLCEAMEKADFDAVAAILRELPALSPHDLMEAQLAAARWVDSLAETSP
jgi:EAL and modified HD-GYP domain-containing signal transduction protein